MISQPSRGFDRSVVGPLIFLTFLGLGALGLVTFLVTEPGFLSPDAGAYHIMASSFEATGGFDIENGYAGSESPLLQMIHFRPHEGRLVSQYPEFWTALASIFYPWLGYQGFFFISALSFLGVVYFTWSLGRELFDSWETGTLAAFILVFGSFMGVWSQSSYPHVFSTLLMLTVCRALLQGAKSGGLLWFVLAGISFGISLGVRTDSFLLVAPLVVFFVFWPKTRWQQVAAFFGGAFPWLAILSWINYVKFGRWSFLSYGNTDHVHNRAESFGPLLVVGLICFCLFWAGWRARGRKQLMLHAAWLLVIGGWLIFGSVATGFAVHPLHGILQLLVESRLRPLGLVEDGALERTASGALVYFDHVKKALLQSCPWVLITFFSLRFLLRSGPESRALLWLWSLPAVFLLFFGMMGWHGSIAHNMRYLTPILPFLAILLAWQLHGLLPSANLGTWLLRMGGLFIFFVGIQLVFLTGKSVARQEVIFLTLPLLLALAGGVGWLFRDRFPRTVAGLILGLVVWSGAVAWTQDYQVMNRCHAGTAEYSTFVRERSDGGSIIFAQIPPYGAYIPRERRVLANPSFGNAEDIEALILEANRSGQPVFWIQEKGNLSPPSGRMQQWNWHELGRLPEEAVDPEFILYRLSAPIP